MSDQTPIPKASSKTRSIIGLVISVLWLALLGLVLFYFDADEMKKLRPNEWGDTLAGWFAPLALFWVVLGYLQQGDELKLNTQALLLQQKEMQEQGNTLREQMMALSRQAQALELQAKVTLEESLKVAKRELEEMRPRFASIGSTGSGTYVQISIMNNGGPAKNIRVTGPKDITITTSPENIAGSGTGLLKIDGAIVYPMNFKILCEDFTGSTVEQEYVLYAFGQFTESSLYDPNSHFAPLAYVS